MRLLLFVGLALLASGSAFVEVEPMGYHQRVGIPEAERIKKLEEKAEHTRIVGGSIAAISAYPYLAGLVINFANIAGQSACGSSMLSANRVVTAAHCWFDGFNQASLFTVVLGSHYLFSGGTRISSSTVVMHPQYDATTLVNDVAMVYLPTSIFFTSNIQPVALPSSLDLGNSFVGELAVAAGYGRTSDAQAGISATAVVSHITLQVISVAQCQATFGSWAQESNICTNGAGGVGICGGDSGGPLVITRNGQPTLVGISSFVAAAGCQLGFPSAFARVTSFYAFILTHLF